jgi:transposase
MTRKNKYYNRSRLSEAKFREVIKYFSVDLSAAQIAQLTHLNLNTINKILTLNAFYNQNLQVHYTLANHQN